MFNFWKKNRNKTLFTDEIIKVRGMPANLSKGESFRTYRPRQIRSIWEPRAINRLISTSSSSGSSSENGINYSGEHKASFYRYLRDSIPIIHAGVWAWVRLCGTKINREFEGSIVEKRKAQFALDRLDYRLLEKPFGYGAGLNKLLQGAFLELFTTGKFACELVLSENGKFIDHVQILDSERIEWQHGDNGWEPYSITDEGEVIKHDSKLFFHATLGIDLTKPQGTEPLACIPFVSEVEQLMLEDMARSSHNAGVPRLQIKVARPERDSWENDSAYSNRANNYFQDVVSEFQNLEADDNIFTWSDVEVSVIGNSGVAFA